MSDGAGRDNNIDAASSSVGTLARNDSFGTLLLLPLTLLLLTPPPTVGKVVDDASLVVVVVDAALGKVTRTPEGSIDVSSASIEDGSTLSKIDGRFAFAAAAAAFGVAVDVAALDFVNVLNENGLFNSLANVFLAPMSLIVSIQIRHGSLLEFVDRLLNR